MSSPAENPSTATATVIADELARSGVTDVIVAPGSRSTALALTFHNDPRFDVHTQLDERSAGFVALGYARVTGRVMPIVVTSGSAVAQLHPAVIEADAAGVPFLILSADRPAELRDTGANQTIRQASLFGDATRFSTHVEVLADNPTSNRYLRSVVVRAVAESHGGANRPGPVQLNVAFREPTVPQRDDGRSVVPDMWREPLDGRADGATWTRMVAPLREPDPAVVSEIAALCNGASGVIVAGSLDRVDDEQQLIDAVDQLADLLGWPVIAEGASMLRRARAAIPHAGHLLSHTEFAASVPIDVVLRVGRTGVTAGVETYLKHATRQILVDPWGSVFDPDRQVTHRVVADVSRFFAALHRHLLQDDSVVAAGYASRFRHAAHTVADVHDKVLAGDDELNEPSTMRVLAGALHADDLLVVGASMPIRDFDLFAPHPLNLPVQANRGASGIDGFISTVRGAAVARKQFTVGVCGDVTFLHDINGLLLRDDDTPVAIVVIDNDGGAIFSFLPQAAYPEALHAVFTMPHGRDLVAIAAGYGAHALSVTTKQALGDALADARQRRGVTVIRVPSNRDENVALHAALRTAAHQALDG